MNDGAYIAPKVMPGGHNALYFVLGLAVAAYGAWWLGVSDHSA